MSLSWQANTTRALHLYAGFVLSRNPRARDSVVRDVAMRQRQGYHQRNIRDGTKEVILISLPRANLELFMAVRAELVMASLDVVELLHSRIMTFGAQARITKNEYFELQTLVAACIFWFQGLMQVDALQSLRLLTTVTRDVQLPALRLSRNGSGDFEAAIILPARQNDVQPILVSVRKDVGALIQLMILGRFMCSDMMLADADAVFCGKQSPRFTTMAPDVQKLLGNYVGLPEGSSHMLDLKRIYLAVVAEQSSYNWHRVSAAASGLAHSHQHFSKLKTFVDALGAVRRCAADFGQSFQLLPPDCPDRVDPPSGMDPEQCPRFPLPLVPPLLAAMMRACTSWVLAGPHCASATPPFADVVIAEGKPAGNPRVISVKAAVMTGCCSPILRILTWPTETGRCPCRSALHDVVCNQKLEPGRTGTRLKCPSVCHYCALYTVIL